MLAKRAMASHDIVDKTDHRQDPLVELLNSHSVNGCIDFTGGSGTDLARDSVSYIPVLPPAGRPGANNGIKNQIEDHFLVT